jgi:16S rRNA (cytosine1402-N4)-methyltransferase
MLCHETVLREEAVTALNVQSDGIYVDATFGRGGHARSILQKLSDKGRLVAFDRDPQAIDSAKSLSSVSQFQIIHSEFSELATQLKQLDLHGQIDGVLMDLGVSSPQIDDKRRGFSFMHDGPLDMRMDPSQGSSAAQWLATAELDEISTVIKLYGEEKFARRIATAIVDSRNCEPLTTTMQLVALIEQAVPAKDKHKHPATRTFQAIRIHINGELEQIEKGLAGALEILKPKGRLVVISFHSLEDRIVKRFMKFNSQGAALPTGLPITQDKIDADKKMKLIGKPIKPSDHEVTVNPRARSSILRVAEKL